MGLYGSVIHDQTRHRTFTDAARCREPRSRDGQRMDFECFVKRRATNGSTEATLMMRTIASVLDKETVIRILTEAPEVRREPRDDAICVETIDGRRNDYTIYG